MQRNLEKYPKIKENMHKEKEGNDVIRPFENNLENSIRSGRLNGFLLGTDLKYRSRDFY